MLPRLQDLVVVIAEHRRLRPNKRQAMLEESILRMRTEHQLHLRQMLAVAAPQGLPARVQSARINWTAVVDRRVRHHRLDLARDVQAWVLSRAKNLVLRGPEAARQNQQLLTVRRILQSLLDHARHRHTAAYVPRVQSHPSVQGLHVLGRWKENPRLRPPLHLMRLVMILRKVIDLEVLLLKEVISQEVQRVQQKGDRILLHLRGNLMNQRKQILKDLMIRDQDLKVRKMIKAIMNRTNPSNKQVCLVLLIIIFRI